MNPGPPGDGTTRRGLPPLAVVGHAIGSPRRRCQLPADRTTTAVAAPPPGGGWVPVGAPRYPSKAACEAAELPPAQENGYHEVWCDDSDPIMAIHSR
ncbi:hypothetical protein ABTY53_30160 [Streptomyces noursei]|uniref:hypothetical protein n=1 Tax=Streptomyces noursei TaxID=1971 RepID=UPI0033258CC2